MPINLFRVRYLPALAVVAACSLLFTVPASAAVGIEYNFMGGQTSGAYDTGNDAYWGLSISVPLWKDMPVIGGDMMGEILIGYSNSHVSGTYTPPPAGVLSSSGLAETAPGGPQNRFNLTVLQVAPGLRYKFTNLLPTIGSPIDPSFVFVPYVSLGMTFNVYLGSTEGDTGTTGCGPRIGGVACNPKELAAINFPVGQGNILPGVEFGAGLDVFVYTRMILGVEIRQNSMIGNSNANYHTILGKVGLTF